MADSILGNIAGQLGDIAKQVGKTTVKAPVSIIKGVPEQIGEKSEDVSQTPISQADNKDTQDIVKSLYGKSNPSVGSGLEQKGLGQANQGQQLTESKKAPEDEFEKELENKSPEEQKELIALRKKLHDETYFDPTFNPVKKQDERPAEKVENEKKQEMQELQQKEQEKPPPLAVQRARNKAEMFPGASG